MVHLVHLAGQVKPMLLLIAEGFREILAYQRCFWGGHVGAYVILFRISLNSTYLEKRLCQQKRRTSTSPSARTITIVLLSMSALDLNLAMPRACGLSRISS